MHRLPQYCQSSTRSKRGINDSANFDYLRVDSVEGALEALQEHGDEAKLIAGGHSLLPLMKFRLPHRPIWWISIA